MRSKIGMLQARFLGVPQLTIDQSALPRALTGKGLALFAYVAAQPGAVSRSKLVDLLWSDVSEFQARENLRSLIYRLRQDLDDYLLVTRHSLALNREVPYWLDTEVFAGLADIQISQKPELLEPILRLYRGDFLEGLETGNAFKFDEWLTDQQRRFRMIAAGGWQRLVDHFVEERQFAEAIAANRELLALSPWNEDAHRQQMRMLIANGQRSLALEQFAICVEQLRRELDVLPSAETTDLYEQIRNQRNRPSPAAPPIDEPQPGHLIRVERGTMPSPRFFVGRDQELRQLSRWIFHERCRVVSILGMAGQGKTTLAARFVEKVAAREYGEAADFEGIVWHSLRNAPPLAEVLRDWIYQLSNQECLHLPETLDRQFDLLGHYIQRRRFLFVLDNVESVLSATLAHSSDPSNPYLQLWEFFLAQEHQSCIVLTAREWIDPLLVQREYPGLYRCILMEGLEEKESAQLLKSCGIFGSQQEIARLHDLYSGNPLALALAAQTIDDLFAGSVHSFLQEGALFLGTLDAILGDQFTRFAPLEQEILVWMALEQEPLRTNTLWQNLLLPPSKRAFLDALNTLCQRGLVRQEGALFRLQTVILEYVRTRLLDGLRAELTEHLLPPNVDGSEAQTTSDPLGLTRMHINRYALCNAQAKEFVRAGQMRLIVTPLLQHLCDYWGGARAVEKKIRQLLALLRQEQERGAPLTGGYAAGNLLTLLSQLCAELSNLDLSHLTLRQVDLRQTRLYNSDLTHAVFDRCLFATAFHAPSCLAPHPAGKPLACGTITGEILCLDLGNQEFVASLHGHTTIVSALAFSPDGRYLFSSGGDRLCCWDMATHSLRFTCRIEGALMRRLAVSPDGQWLAVPGHKSIAFYSVASGQACGVWATQTGLIRTLVFSPDGKWLAGGDSGGGFHLWKFASPADTSADPVYVAAPHGSSLHALIFSHDSRFLFSAGHDSLIRQWAVADLCTRPPSKAQPAAILAGHTEDVNALSIGPTGNCLASGGSNGELLLWDIATGRQIDSLNGHSWWISDITFLQTTGLQTAGLQTAGLQTTGLQTTGLQTAGLQTKARQEPGFHLLASISADQRLLIWEVDHHHRRAQARLFSSMRAYTAAQEACSFTAAGSHLISGGPDGKVRLWSTHACTPPTLLYENLDWITDLALHKETEQIAWSGLRGKIWLSTYRPTHSNGTDAAGPYKLAPPRLLEEERTPSFCLDFAPDGALLASATWNGAINLWHTGDGRLLRQLRKHTEIVFGLAFSPDGTLLASASRDGLICVWQMPARQADSPGEFPLLTTLTDHKKGVRCLAFTPDSQLLVSGSGDQTLRIWQRDGQCLRVLEHRASVGWLAISPCVVDGRLRMASADQQSQICIWDVHTGELLHTWQEDRGQILQLEFSPDGTLLAACGMNGHLHLWDACSATEIRTQEIRKPYADTFITGAAGITQTQRDGLLLLGAQDES